jgi:excinuclease ABC subunit C
VGRIEPADHKALALGLASFMDGKDDGVLDSLRYDMLQAAERLDFEHAAKLRDRIEAIETILVKNTMVLDDTIDADVFGLAHDDLHAAAHVFRIRGGRIRQARGWVVDVDKKPSRSELVELILRDGFDEHFPPAKLIIVPELPHEADMWSERLTQQRKVAGERGGAEMRVAKRGDLATLSDTVRLNAAQTLQGYLSKRQNDVVSRSAALAELADYLGLEEAPLRIECFDVSHLGGENQVASMVVFEDGIPRREHYRKFAIDGARDDTEAIYQVVSRRLKRLTEPESPEGEEKTKNSFAYPPGLFVIDGGLPQVNAAKRALDEAGVSIGVCGLAKRLEEVWRPADQFPLVLPRSSEALFLLQRVRDEAHRVAISYQRTTRKRSLRSQLLDVPGVGEAMAARLLKSFGSVAAVKGASVEDLCRVPGVGSELAERIHQALR